VESLRSQIRTINNNRQFQQNGGPRNYSRPHISQYTPFHTENFSSTQAQNFQKSNKPYKRVQFWKPQGFDNFNSEPISRHSSHAGHVARQCPLLSPPQPQNSNLQNFAQRNRSPRNPVYALTPDCDNQVISSPSIINTEIRPSPSIPSVIAEDQLMLVANVAYSKAEIPSNPPCIVNPITEKLSNHPIETSASLVKCSDKLPMFSSTSSIPKSHTPIGAAMPERRPMKISYDSSPKVDNVSSSLKITPLLATNNCKIIAQPNPNRSTSNVLPEPVLDPTREKLKTKLVNPKLTKPFPDSRKSPVNKKLFTRTTYLVPPVFSQPHSVPIPLMKVRIPEYIKMSVYQILLSAAPPLKIVTCNPSRPNASSRSLRKLFIPPRPYFSEHQKPPRHSRFPNPVISRTNNEPPSNSLPNSKKTPEKDIGPATLTKLPPKRTAPTPCSTKKYSSKIERSEIPNPIPTVANEIENDNHTSKSSLFNLKAVTSSTFLLLSHNMDVKTIVPTRRCRKCEQISTVTRNES
jgi:hypothetical protein